LLRGRLHLRRWRARRLRAGSGLLPLLIDARLRLRALLRFVAGAHGGRRRIGRQFRRRGRERTGRARLLRRSACGRRGLSPALSERREWRGQQRRREQRRDDN
jgi:hypothetical protein